MGSIVIIVDATTSTSLMDGLDWQVVKYIVASMKWLKENGWSNNIFFFFARVVLYLLQVMCCFQKSIVLLHSMVFLLHNLQIPSSAKAPVHAHFGELDDFVGFQM
jgi:hypothetical protein